MNAGKIVGCGSCGLACFHLVVCGLPLLAAAVGAVSPFAGFVPPAAMNLLLAAAGAALIAAWIFGLRRCDCNKKLLIFSTAIFMTALFTHFVLPQTIGVEPCH